MPIRRYIPFDELLFDVETGNAVYPRKLGHTDLLATAGPAIGEGEDMSVAVQAALALKAPLNSPTFTGVPAVPTAAQGTDTTQSASTAFVRAEAGALIGAAPGALDTLNELAAALGDDANFAASVTTALALKASAASVSNVTNTSDANKPVSTAQQAALDLKQPLDSDLTAIAALTTTAFGRAVLALANAGALATAAGVGTGDSPTFTGVTVGTVIITNGAANFAGILYIPIAFPYDARMWNGGAFGWSSNQNPSLAAMDTGFSRNAAGVVEIHNGTPGIFRDLKLRNLEATGEVIAATMFTSTAAYSGVSIGTTAASSGAYFSLNRNGSTGAIIKNTYGGAQFTVDSSNARFETFNSAGSNTGTYIFGAGFALNNTSAVTGIRTAVATLNFASILAAGFEDLTITVTGAAVGMAVIMGLPATVVAGVVFNAWVSAADTVTIRANNAGTIAADPASASYRATVISF